MAHPSTFAAGRRTGGERAGAAARHVPGQRLARVGSSSIFGRIEGIAVCAGVSQTGHTARLVQKVCTSRSRRRWLVCLVLDTAALGPAGGSGTAGETEVTRMMVPMRGNGRPTAGSLRGAVTIARGPAARRTARHWGTGAGQHGPRRANLQGHLKRSEHAASPSRSTTAEEHPDWGARWDQGGAASRSGAGRAVPHARRRRGVTRTGHGGAG